MKSLEGDYRLEHLITLRHSLDLYRHYQLKIGELDKKMEAFMSACRTAWISVSVRCRRGGKRAGRINSIMRRRSICAHTAIGFSGLI
jgi:hypothetical protein